MSVKKVMEGSLGWRDEAALITAGLPTKHKWEESGPWSTCVTVSGFDMQFGFGWVKQLPVATFYKSKQWFTTGVHGWRWGLCPVALTGITEPLSGSDKTKPLVCERVTAGQARTFDGEQHSQHKHKRERYERTCLHTWHAPLLLQVSVWLN